MECAPTAGKLSGHACEAEWHSQLAETMAEIGGAVADEAITELLRPDLGTGPCRVSGLSWEPLAGKAGHVGNQGMFQHRVFWSFNLGWQASI